MSDSINDCSIQGMMEPVDLADPDSIFQSADGGDYFLGCEILYEKGRVFLILNPEQQCLIEISPSGDVLAYIDDKEEVLGNSPEFYIKSLQMKQFYHDGVKNDSAMLIRVAIGLGALILLYVVMNYIR